MVVLWYMEELSHIIKSHNVSMLIYHLVCPAKYRRTVFDKHERIESEIRRVCLEIEKRYEINFLEIGADRDHVHFMIQSVPTMSPKSIVSTVKSLTAREVFKNCPEEKESLWGGEFWTKGYYINTVGKAGNAEGIRMYIQSQGSEYKSLHTNQLKLFE